MRRIRKVFGTKSPRRPREQYIRGYKERYVMRRLNCRTLHGRDASRRATAAIRRKDKSTEPYRSEESKEWSVERYCVALAWHGRALQSIRWTTDDRTAKIDAQLLTRSFWRQPDAATAAGQYGDVSCSGPTIGPTGLKDDERRLMEGALWTDCQRSSLFCDCTQLDRTSVLDDRRLKSTTEHCRQWVMISSRILRGCCWCCCCRCHIGAVVITASAFIWQSLWGKQLSMLMAYPFISRRLILSGLLPVSRSYARRWSHYSLIFIPFNSLRRSVL